MRRVRRGESVREESGGASLLEKSPEGRVWKGEILSRVSGREESGKGCPEERIRIGEFVRE
jgi:hypothetical protein